MHQMQQYWCKTCGVCHFWCCWGEQLMNNVSLCIVESWARSLPEALILCTGAQ